MLEYLEQGNVLYVLAALCLIGVITKLAVNHVYRGLIQQADNVATAKDKQLQQMKTKYESIYRLNSGVKNSGIFVEKRLAQYRLFKLRLKNWEYLDLQLGGAGVILCMLAAYGIFWMEGDLKISAMYLSIGAMTACGVYLFHSLADSKENRKTLASALCHYFENVLIVRGPRNIAVDAEQEEEVHNRGGMRDDIFIKKSAKGSEKQNEQVYEQEEMPSRTKVNQKAEMEALKESLSQIAAARSEGNEKRSRRLTQKEEQLIDEILRQYLS